MPERGETDNDVRVVAAADYGRPDELRSATSGFRDGGGRTTRIDYVNRNKQKCAGHRGRAGTDHNQLAYRMECLSCGNVYGANGSDVFQRKCPNCQNGEPGIGF